MTEAENTATQRSVEYTSPPGATETSIRYTQALAETAEELRASIPEFQGLTYYGSTARGEARAPGTRDASDQGSDVDVFVFFRPDPNSYIQGGVHSDIPERYRTGISTKGESKGSTIFESSIRYDYNLTVREVAAHHGLPTHGDTEAVPINEEIVADQVSRLLATAELVDASQTPDCFPSRNLQGLFHVSAGNDNLVEYRRQVVVLLALSPHGETAWRALRGRVGYFEVGRDKEQYLPRIDHRRVPETLAEAVMQYGAADSHRPS
ncbi:MAG TPA: nucleotidyltransferase domain-containing protein [Verrucomicrobiae bacterium]|nr:nucleotidyltransferase domain-containing protein [Verrucomicrobiae bacterium]